MSRFELIWSYVIRGIAAGLGVFIAIWETLSDKVGHPWAYAASATFMGLPLARALENIVRTMATASSSEPEPESDERRRERRR